MRCRTSSLLAVACAKMPTVLSDKEREARMAKYCLENKDWDAEIQSEVKEWLDTPVPNESAKTEFFKGVRMPQDKADVLRFLKSMDGPRDEHRKLEDEVAVKGLSLDPVICRRLGIPLETRGTFFGGIDLDFLEEDDFKAMLEKRERGEPLFMRDNFSTVDDYRVEAAEELKRMVEECKAIQWRDVSPPPDTSIAPMSIIIKAHRIRAVNDWSIVGLSAMLRDLDTHYGSTLDLVRVIVKWAHVWGLDLKDCFWEWLISPQFRRLMGLHDITVEEEGRVITLLFAAMGLSSSPGISDAGVKSFISAVETKYPSVKILDYVDDIRGTSPKEATNFEKVCKDMQRVRSAWSFAGLRMHPLRPEKLDKFIYPTQECAWIGFLVSTSLMVVKIDPEKLADYIEALGEFLSQYGGGEVVGMRELASMIGKLNFVALVVRSGRAFLRSACDLLVRSGVVAAWAQGKRKTNPKLQLGPQVIADLKWWLDTLRGDPFIPILTTTTGKSVTFTVDLLDEPELFKELDPSYFIVITTDASGIQWGVMVGADEVRHTGCFQFCAKAASSNKRELSTILEWLEAHGDEYKGKRILIRTDNVCTRHYVNCVTGRKPDLCTIGKRIAHEAAIRGISLLAQHIRGKHNITADALSRLLMNSTLSDSHPEKQLEPRVFSALQSRLEVKFSMDAMCSRDGHNKLCSYFLSHMDDAYKLEPKDVVRELVWWHPSLDQIWAVCKKLKEWMKLPLNERPAAVFLAPKYKSRFAFLYANFHTVARFQKNRELFRNKEAGQWRTLPRTDYTYLVLSTLPRDKLRERAQALSSTLSGTTVTNKP